MSERVEPEVKAHYDAAVKSYGELRARCLLALWRNKFELGCRYSKAAEAYIKDWPRPRKQAPVAAQTDEGTEDGEGYGWKEATFSYDAGDGEDGGMTSPTSALSSSFSELDVDRRPARGRGRGGKARREDRDGPPPSRRQPRARKDSYSDEDEEASSPAAVQRDRFGRPVRGAERGKGAKRGSASAERRNSERVQKNGKSQQRVNSQLSDRDAKKGPQSDRNSGGGAGAYKWVQKQPNGKNAPLTRVGGRSRGGKAPLVPFVSGGTQKDPLAEDDDEDSKGCDESAGARSPDQKPMDTAASPTSSNSNSERERERPKKNSRQGSNSASASSSSSRASASASASASSGRSSSNANGAPREQNPVSLLNEYCQKAHPRLQLEFERIEGSNRVGRQSNQISFRVLINRRQVATARGINPKIAKRNAAANAIEVLERQNPSTRDLLNSIKNKKPVVLSEEKAVQRASVLELGDASISKPIGKENKGRRIMERMGWKGGGCGKGGHGVLEVPTILLMPQNGTDGLGYVPPPHVREAKDFRGGAGARLIHFLSSDDMEIQFSNELSKAERAVVHTLAEKYNLIHRSFGKGVERALIVKKRTANGRPQRRPQVGQLNRY